MIKRYQTMWLILILSSIFLSAGVVKASADTYTAKVIKIIDGDTVVVLKDDKTQIKLRLAEIDAPEKHQPWGNRSRKAISNLIFGHKVKVIVSGQDRYGRSIAHLKIHGMDVNQEMITTGNAWVYKKYSKDQKLLAAEKTARKQKIGLWSLTPDEILPPWEFRRWR